MDKPGVFIFDFQDSETESARVCAFVWTPEGNKSLQVQQNDDYEFYNDTVSDIECDFGVHDYGSLYGAMCDQVESMSFTSYEILGPEVDRCMKAWHQRIQDLIGKEHVSACWYDITDVVENDWTDYDIYKAVLQREAS